MPAPKSQTLPFQEHLKDIGSRAHGLTGCHPAWELHTLGPGPGTMLYLPSFLPTFLLSSYSLHGPFPPWVWSVIMLTPNEKTQLCGGSIIKECQHLPGMGHARVSGLSLLCGHCWPRLKSISQCQAYPHSWGPTPLILCRPLTITTS
jgi:hypothetical protein